jgi:hypothetical protein
MYMYITSGFSSYKYVQSENRTIWTKKKYMGSECKAILDLPSGNHILSIQTNHSDNDKHQSKISHIILWP